MKKTSLSLLAVALVTGWGWLGCGQDTSPFSSGGEQADSKGLVALTKPGNGNGGGGNGGGGNGGGGGDKNTFDVRIVEGADHWTPQPIVPGEPILSSICKGSGDQNTFFATWRGTDPTCVNITPITPTGFLYPLTYDPQLGATYSKKADKITEVQFWIQDVPGETGILHTMRPVSAFDSDSPSPSGFTIHVHASNVAVWKFTGKNGGKKVKTEGTISIGDIVYTPVTP